MMKKILFVTAIASMTVGCATFKDTKVAEFKPAIDRNLASECMNGKDWECKNARRNDGADQYMLDKYTGNFYRYFKSSGQTCQVTNNVKSFKISQHPQDAASVYYLTNDDNLWVATPQENYGNCPKVSKKAIMNDVKEYSVVSNTHSTIVNAALSKYGRFVAWGNVNALVSQDGVVDYEMNNCFGSEGKSFSSYVLFTLDNYGDVRKVKLQGSESYAFDESKTQRGSWRNLGEWKSDQGGICK